MKRYLGSILRNPNWISQPETWALVFIKHILGDFNVQQIRGLVQQEKGSKFCLELTMSINNLVNILMWSWGKKQSATIQFDRFSHEKEKKKYQKQSMCKHLPQEGILASSIPYLPEHHASQE